MKGMTRSGIYKNLDDVLSYIHNSGNEWILSSDISSSLKDINPRLIHQLLLRLEEDGLIIYKDNSVSRIKIDGIIFLSGKGYKNIIVTERLGKIERWVKFGLLLISGLGVLVTISISWMNYNLSKHQNDEKIHKIENKLDSIGNVHKIQN